MTHARWKRQTIATAVLATLVAAAAAAEPIQLAALEDEDLAFAYGDKNSVSLATGAKQSIRRAPAVASVITAEDIAAIGATDIDDVLETVPGLHVTRSASMRDANYLVRGVYGLYNAQVLVLRNGVPLTRTMTGGKGNSWNGLSLENVSRIEIIRGPGSALYGSDAFAGVINIVTKTAEEIDGTRYGVRLASHNTREAWVEHGAKNGALAVAGYLLAGATDGFRETVARDAQSRLDGLFGTNASLAPGAVNTGMSKVDAHLDLAVDKWRWRTGYKYRDDVGSYAGVASALDPVGYTRNEQITTDLSWTDPAFAQDWAATATLAYMQYDQAIPQPFQLFPPGATFPTGTFPRGMFGAPEYTERNTRLSASAAYSGFAKHQVRIGFGHDDLDLAAVREYRNFDYTATGLPIPTGKLALSATPFNSPHRRKLNYIYVQDEWNFARDWTLTAGLRRDDYSDFGGTTNPRLALVWDVNLDLTAKLMYGHAFRAPAFNELYSINNPQARGNPGLRPETNRTLELAFTWQARKDLTTNLNFFRYEMKDIIRTTPNPAPAPGSTYNNAGSQHGSGMELEAVWEASRNLHVVGHYSYQKSIEETSGADAGMAPHHKLYLRADWVPVSGWMLSGQVIRVAGRERMAGDVRPAVDDYTTVDVTARTTRRGKGVWNWGITVRNLLDADVREPSTAASGIVYDLPQPGRTVWLQATHDL